MNLLMFIVANSVSHNTLSVDSCQQVFDNKMLPSFYMIDFAEGD